MSQNGDGEKQENKLSQLGHSLFFEVFVPYVYRDKILIKKVSQLGHQDKVFILKPII